MLQRRPNTFAQTILSLSFFACDKAADHTFRFARNPSAITNELSRLRLDLIHRHHSHFHVLVDVAVEHPGSDFVGNHVSSYELRGQN